MNGQKGNQEPWTLERRAFLKLGAGMGLGTLLLGWANPVKAALIGQSPGMSVTPRGSARNCVMIVLRGGPSHIDTFDIKLGNWTPNKLGVDKISAGYLWPLGIMPKLAQRANRFTLIRSLQHQEVVHERAQYFTETGRRLNPGLRAEIPHIGAVVALESEEKRAANDIFPGFIMFTYGAYTNNGFLSASYAPFMVSNPGYGIQDLMPSDGSAAFDRRRAALRLINEAGNNPLSSSRQSFPIFQDQAEKMMQDPITTTTFLASNDDQARYGNNYFGTSLAVARNVLKANRGTRFIEVDQYGWDNHSDIYSDDEYSLPALCRQLDQGLSTFIDDLAAAPGTTTGKTLLDETFVVVLGEFGRTTGVLNSSRGRDHYPYVFSGLFAGGGIQGGRIIGATDELGEGAKDFGWKYPRPIHLPDVVTTIYSVLGIDWTKVITNTPSNRIYRYADPEAIGDEDSYEIYPLF
ncbi:MAG: DUF1501 domain-containing protein [Acidobacteriota bacterium]